MPAQNSRVTEQIRIWTGDFGREYTQRNSRTPVELDELYRGNYGITRTELNQLFVDHIPRRASILEVGCNIGTQLLMLQQMGFSNLHGIEIQSYALGMARERLPEAKLIEASAFSIPYPDQFFDLVFTAGVLIHIAPDELPVALEEIHRCAKQWIWGFEYYSSQPTEVVYRGKKTLLWKNDYARLYLQQFSDLELVRETLLPYLVDDNVDTMFLLRRKS